MDKYTIYTILILNLITGIYYYINKKCEIPFFLAFFNIMVQYRLLSLELGYGEWVNYDYGVDFVFNLKIAYEVSVLILIGTSILMYSFMGFYNPNKKRIRDNDNYLKEFILSKKPYIIVGLAVFSVLQIALAKSNAGGYGFLGKLGNTSFIILLFLVIINTDTKKGIVKIFYIGLFFFMTYLTWSSGLRFQFLGWMIPIGYYMVRNIKPSLKVFYIIAGIFFMMTIFSVARTLTYVANKKVSYRQILDLSFQRMLIADDINFIDGFMMMYEIYPRYLDYDYGLEHLDIVLRPIPRAIWPSKPLAGWFQNFAAKYGKKTQMVGFSPTIYGVFYAEGAQAAIIIFSVLWAWALARLYSSFSGFTSILSIFCIGILLSSLVPILRSGDLPGDFAVVFMSYWPFIIFVRRYKKFVKKQLIIEQIKKMTPT